LKALSDRCAKPSTAQRLRPNNAGKVTGVSGSVSNIENVMGGSGNDQLTGNSQGKILDGNGGNDVLLAVSGSSILVGGGHGKPQAVVITDCKRRVKILKNLPTSLCIVPLGAQL
jgi:Ca2+-binding RTX toxin-like protein